MAANTTQVIDGNKMMIFLNPTGGTSNLQPCAFSTNAKLTVTTGERERSSKDSGIWKSFAPDRMDWVASTETLLNLSGVTGTTLSTKELFAAKVAQTLVYVSFAIAAGNTPSWTVNQACMRFSGYAFITSMDFNAALGADATASISLRGTDALTEAG
jgi:hypothetical protein